MGVDWEIFLYKLVDNEISNEKWVQIQFEFLKCPNKMQLNFLRNFSENLNIFQSGYPLIKMRTFFS